MNTRFECGLRNWLDIVRAIVGCRHRRGVLGAFAIELSPDRVGRI